LIQRRSIWLPSISGYRNGGEPSSVALRHGCSARLEQPHALDLRKPALKLACRPQRVCLASQRCQPILTRFFIGRAVKKYLDPWLLFCWCHGKWPRGNLRSPLGKSPGRDFAVRLGELPRSNLLLCGGEFPGRNLGHRRPLKNEKGPPPREQRAFGSCRNAMGRHYVGGAVFDPRCGLRLVSCVLRQHQRQDVRNVLNVGGPITTVVIIYCQVRGHGNLPKRRPRKPTVSVF